MSDVNYENGTTGSDASRPFDGITVEQSGYSLYLLIPDTDMECRCSFVPNEQGTAPTCDELAEILCRQGVLEGIDEGALDDFAAGAADGLEQTEVLLASGTPPVDGSDAYFVQTLPTATAVRSGDKSHNNAGIYRCGVQTFVNVLADEEIGRITPAEPGTPGMNIKGLPIPHQAGKPLKSRMGMNIRVEENGTLLIAAATGRFYRSDREFSVEAEYVVKVEQPGYSLCLQIPDTFMECRCSYVPNGQGTMLTRDELAAVLNQQGVLAGIDQEALDGFVAGAAAGRELSDVLLASGTPPVEGSDGYFVQTVPDSTVIRGEDKDEDSVRIDMYIVQTFVNVHADEEIGRIVPVVPGTFGLNIKGLPIPPKACKPLQNKIGKHIRVEENGTLLIASATGRFYKSESEFSVEEEYIVDGDVDFNIGVINFKGFVEVRGDVLDNFNITATKGLTVTGNIGFCSIVCDGDVTFCGMDGQNRGSIVCGGTLRANFIHNTDIECAGDVIVEVEIHDCTIRTLGRIIVNKDTITGGSYIAQGGIESKKLGSPSARYTSLLVGVDYRYIEELKLLLADLTKTQAKIREARSLDEITPLRDKAAKLSERIAIIRNKAVAASNAKINVKKTLHENVQMALGDVQLTVCEMKDGPLTIIENIVDGGLRFIPMSAMDVKAADIEKEFVLEHELELEAQRAENL